MEHPPDEPKSQLVARIREAMAEDPRTNSLDVQVTVAGGKVFLHGEVSTPELREAIEQVVREHLIDVALVNGVVVTALSEGIDAEWMG